MAVIEQIPPYIVWPIRHQVMYPEMDFDAIKLPDDENGMHLGLYENGKLISVVSLFSEGENLQFRKFATLDEFQGKGYGSQLLRFVIDEAKQQGFTRVWCNARTNASSFYQKFGFNETSVRFFKDGYDFVIMELLFKD
ncbi:GNAT family N-acetyltransferase [Desertivirga xinjiangensis]|uniref:GNAT family N-acetyltransferase n=1 Tax=Desertivirga xinjiangensis TaxID=539206 RepID=UPI00210DECD4|nr:GNAT family N-acetyltransferase [Pedobacter xinjiangensis]